MQARRWYARSALAGDADGQNNLGACFQHGLGGLQSYRQAAYWYRKAALAGRGCACSNLAHCHLRAYGVPKDEGLALYWFQAALELGHSESEEWVVYLRAKAAQGNLARDPSAPAGEPAAVAPPARHPAAAGLQRVAPELLSAADSESFFVDVTEEVMRHGFAIMGLGPHQIATSPREGAPPRPDRASPGSDDNGSF